MQCYTISIITCLLAVAENRSVVSPNLSRSSPLRRGTVKVFENQCFYRMYTMVNTHRHHINTESVFFRWIETELRTGTKYERSDVHGGAGGVWRDIGSIQGDSHIDTM